MEGKEPVEGGALKDPGDGRMVHVEVRTGGKKVDIPPSTIPHWLFFVLKYRRKNKLF